MRLTKTDYLHWRDCRHNAWWRMNAPDLYHARPPSAFEQTIIDAGDEVEALAGRLFLRGSGLLRDDVAVARADVDGRRAVLLGSAFATDTLATTCDILAWTGAADLYTNNPQLSNLLISLHEMVGGAGIEPATPPV